MISGVITRASRGVSGRENQCCNYPNRPWRPNLPNTPSLTTSFLPRGHITTSNHHNHGRLPREVLQRRLLRRRLPLQHRRQAPRNQLQLQITPVPLRPPPNTAQTSPTTPLPPPRPPLPHPSPRSPLLPATTPPARHGTRSGNGTQSRSLSLRAMSSASSPS